MSNKPNITKVWNAKEAREQTKPFDLKDAMFSIGQAIENQENKVLISPSKFVDENLKHELMSRGYRISYFTDQFCGLQGLLIEW